MDEVIDSGDVQLRAHLALPPPSAAARSGRRGVILCHAFPMVAGGAATASQTFPELADRIAVELGWVALTFAFRGSADSEGNFSIRGWIADLRAAVDYLLAREHLDGVWLAGFGAGGSVCLCVAAEDERIKGVAAMGARADFQPWAADPRRFLEIAREVGAIRDRAFPVDLDAWSRELREVRPLAAIAAIPPRPVLLVHGTEDDQVPAHDARALKDAGGDDVELRLVKAAGHRLRHDPRVIALLLGWLGRQDFGVGTEGSSPPRLGTGGSSAI